MRHRIMFQNFRKNTRIAIKSISQHGKQDKLMSITQLSEALDNKLKY